MATGMEGNGEEEQKRLISDVIDICEDSADSPAGNPRGESSSCDKGNTTKAAVEDMEKKEGDVTENIHNSTQPPVIDEATEKNSDGSADQSKSSVLSPDMDKKEGDVIENIPNSTQPPVIDEATEATEKNSDGSADQSKKSNVLSPDGSTEKTDGKIDVYGYTKLGEFTSEMFKIAIKGLPKKFQYPQLRNKLRSLKLKPVKIKPAELRVAYVNFRNEEEREEAIEKLNNHEWKGEILSAKKVGPAADPFLKRKQEQGNSGGSDAKKSKVVKEDDDLPLNERLNNSITPLWKVPYEEQLKSKQKTMTEFLENLNRKIAKENPDLMDWCFVQKNLHSGKCCPLEEIKPSPLVDGYRNKCEFTCGKTLDGSERRVGFRLGKYSDGSLEVVLPTDALNCNDEMKKVCKSFQDYVQASSRDVYNPVDHRGYWRQITVRTCCKGSILVIVCLHPQKLTQEELEAEKTLLKEYFSTGVGQDAGVTSLFLNKLAERTSEDIVDELIFGEEHITERLLDMDFRISPNAFFQVNTPAAEVLYTTVAEWCTVSPKTLLYDVCCGTGTIGLSMAKQVEKVVGVELCGPAVEDAKFNSTLNNIENAEFICGKAEEHMSTLTDRSVGSEVMVIVDPPRAGLHPSVIRALRRNVSLKNLVYVSCNVNGALQNFLDLVRPSSKRLKGEPFLPVKAVPVDLFPHTNHCELVVLFQRENTR